jgi:hypothetical protein
MTKNDGGVWRCKDALQTNLHDSIVCPEGSFVKTRSGVEAGCSVLGMNCTLNGKKYSDCLCRPCIYRDEVEIFSSGVDNLDLSNLDQEIEKIKREIIDYDRREQKDGGTKAKSFSDILNENFSSTEPPAGEAVPLPDTGEGLGTFPMEEGKEMQQMASGTPETIHILFPLPCQQNEVCLPGLQQRSLSPLLVKDHLMRRPGSANFRWDCPAYHPLLLSQWCCLISMLCDALEPS